MPIDGTGLLCTVDTFKVLYDKRECPWSHPPGLTENSGGLFGGLWHARWKKLINAHRTTQTLEDQNPSAVLHDPRLLR